MQIQLGKTLDVEVVEGQLAELWKQITGEAKSEEDVAVMRARVANLLVFVTTDARCQEVHELLLELTARHPSRVLLMRGLDETPDIDIAMELESLCQTDKRTGARRLCCEEITLKAQGSFVDELPSAALPLLVSDLATFLWWRAPLANSDSVFTKLVRASDRLVIDSADFADTARDLSEVNKLFTETHARRTGVSDLNWARLTFWRGLLADFYDVPAYQPLLDALATVRIDYVGPEHAPESVAPQALLFAGWLAGRLGWQLSDEQVPNDEKTTTSFTFRRGTADASQRGSSLIPGSLAGQPGGGGTVSEGLEDRTIKVELNRVARAAHKPGRLVQVELRSSHGRNEASFIVTRSADNVHLLAEARLGPTTQRGRVLPVRNRSAAQLLSREMEILCNDQIYQEAIATAALLIEHLRRSSA
jgi:glucose-6-phosphate dehydrogenase assembly protein OpcA